MTAYQDPSAWLLGTTFFGTGGGGDPTEAATIYQQLANQRSWPELIPLSAADQTGVLVTAFGVGAITPAGDPTSALIKGLKLLSQNLDKKIVGIIPVEVGPKATATALLLASLTNLPLIDADCVGGRSTPEVFLETITLGKVARTPAVVINQAGAAAILAAAPSPTFEEAFFRSFAVNSGNQAFVIGYPMSSVQVKNWLATGTISQAYQVGRLLKQKKLAKVLQMTRGQTLFQGKITAITQQNQVGFTAQTIQLTNATQTAKLYLKNENLIFWIADQVRLTCPDLIILLDKFGRPLYNTAIEVGQAVTVVGVPAAKLWRTKAGCDLFDPAQFDPTVQLTLLR